MSTDQIQIYVNLEPSAVSCKEAGNSLNFTAYYNHLLRAVEIPMIQFLEQIYNEAATRAQKDPGTTPREFQLLLREFVREPSQQRQQIFMEHIRSGKHSIEHLGTMALMAVRTLTQSLAGEDYELVALAQSTTDVARYYVQTGITYAKLFLDAISEAARQIDRNPMYFSRDVKSKEYLENRKMIRSQIASSLRASIDDIAIKAYSSLRQHIAERTLKNSNANNAMSQENQGNTLLKEPVPTTTTAAIVASIAPVAQVSPQKQQEWITQPSPPATPPLIITRKQPQSTMLADNRNLNVAEFDQRASPMSSNDAKLAQKDFVQTMLTVSNKANQMQQQQQQQSRGQQSRPSLPTNDVKSINFGTGRVQLENNTTRSVELPKQTISEPLRATSAGALTNVVKSKETNVAPNMNLQIADEEGTEVEQSEQNVLESMDLLTKDE